MEHKFFVLDEVPGQSRPRCAHPSLSRLLRRFFLSGGDFQGARQQQRRLPPGRHSSRSRRTSFSRSRECPAGGAESSADGSQPSFPVQRPSYPDIEVWSEILSRTVGECQGCSRKQRGALRTGWLSVFVVGRLGVHRRRHRHGVDL